MGYDRDMPEQLRLFDMEPTVDVRPPTHSETKVSPAHDKMMRNRERIVGQHSHADEMHTKRMSDYGIPVRGAAAHLTALDPFDTSTWRRFGQYAEMPLHGNDALPDFGTGQRYVNPGRVADIERDPSLASDPRFPGPTRPLVADIGFRRNNIVQHAPVLFNGNHRVAAETRRQLFIDVSYIPRERLGEAAAHARAKREQFRESRQQGDDVAWRRISGGDPTIK